MVSLTEQDVEFDVFNHSGFNGKILMIGNVESFYQCYYCGNATEHQPRFCPKCYGISGFQVISARMFNSQPVDKRFI